MYNKTKFQRYLDMANKLRREIKRMIKKGYRKHIEDIWNAIFGKILANSGRTLIIRKVHQEFQL